MTSSSTFSSCWTSLRARSSAMLDRSRSSSIAPLAPGEGGMQTASYYAHFPSLWQPARAWTSSLEFLRGYEGDPYAPHPSLDLEGPGGIPACRGDALRNYRRGAVRVAPTLLAPSIHL